MGQAKRRGTFEERRMQSLLARALAPSTPIYKAKPVPSYPVGILEQRRIEAARIARDIAANSQ